MNKIKKIIIEKILQWSNWVIKNMKVFQLQIVYSQIITKMIPILKEKLYTKTKQKKMML